MQAAWNAWPQGNNARRRSPAHDASREMLENGGTVDGSLRAGLEAGEVDD
jgi:hypothetical protein